jgi:excisionase family DNA binding protein
MTDTSIWTVEEVAAYFKVNPRTIYRMVQRGEIPAFRVGNQWRFKKEAVENWTEPVSNNGNEYTPTQTETVMALPN